MLMWSAVVAWQVLWVLWSSGGTYVKKLPSTSTVEASSEMLFTIYVLSSLPVRSSRRGPRSSVVKQVRLNDGCSRWQPAPMPNGYDTVTSPQLVGQPGSPMLLAPATPATTIATATIAASSGHS